MSDVQPSTPSDDEKRWSIAIDNLLNSGTLYPYMHDFWQFVDGEITQAEWDDRRPS